MQDYLEIPKVITVKDALNNECRLSAKSFKNIQIINHNVKTISELIIEKPISGNEVGSLAYVKQSDFLFLKTKAIQDVNFTLDFVTVGTFDFIKPEDFKKNIKENKKLSKDDILFVTGGNVGAVCIADKDYNNILISSHIIKIITNKQLYVYAFLKNNLSKEQANFAPEGSIKGLDTFKIDFLLNIKIPFPNLNSDNAIKFVEVLTQAIINKESLIKQRHKSIIEQIESELSKNQNTKKFKFELPLLNEIEAVGRLDVARYSIEYKEFEHLIFNYKNGSFKLSEKGYSVKRGQNLQISNIGESYYSERHIKGFYRLAVSSNFSEYSTVEKLTYIGNPNNLTKIQQGEIVFSARGAQFGRVIIYPETIENVITNIDSLVISNPDAPLYQSIFIAMFLNRLRWNKHIYKIAITGSGANSLTSYQSDDINFPNFPKDKQKEIALLYHNPNSNYQADTFTLDNFLEKDNAFNETAGIYELDKTAKQLKEILNKAIDDIANDREVSINFNL